MSQKLKGLPENSAGNLVILAGVYPYDSFWDPLIPSIFKKNEPTNYHRESKGPPPMPSPQENKAVLGDYELITTKTLFLAGIGIFLGALTNSS